MRTPLSRTIAFALTALALAAPAAVAQTSGRPPARPVFGGAASTSNDSTTLDLAVDVAEAFDQNRSAEAGGGTTPSPYQTSGFYGTISPTVHFNAGGPKLRLSVSGGSNERYYPDLARTVATNHFVGAGVTADITSSTSFTFNQGVTYAPAYLYGLFARNAAPALGDVVAPASDYTVNDQRSYAYSTSAGMTHKISPRASLTFTGNARRTDFVIALPGYFDQRGYDLGGAYTYSLDRHVSVRLGYVYRSTVIQPGQTPIENSVDAGVDYMRPLSRTRRMAVGVHGGPTFVSGSLAIGTLGAARTMGFNGEAFADYQFTRTWHARASYQRGFSYIPGLPAPAYSDGASAQIRGFLGRRVDLSLSAAATTGSMPSQATAARFTTYSTDLRLRVALTRMVAAYVDGIFYDYSFDPSLILPPSVPHHMTRSGARAGLTLWLPAIAPRMER